jgi:hypothetical protein
MKQSRITNASDIAGEVVKRSDALVFISAERLAADLLKDAEFMTAFVKVLKNILAK